MLPVRPQGVLPGRGEPGGGRVVPAPHGQPHHPRSSAQHLPGPRPRPGRRGHHRRSGDPSALGGSGPSAHRIGRHDDQGGGHRAKAEGPVLSGQNLTRCCCTGVPSSSASRWRCTVCTPSSTAGDGTGVRGHRCAGIETQPKRAFADVAANWGQNWNSSPAALRWSVAGLLDLNSRSQLRGNGGQMVTRHKNADRTTNIARRSRRDTDSAGTSLERPPYPGVAVADSDRAREGGEGCELNRHGACRPSTGARSDRRRDQGLPAPAADRAVLGHRTGRGGAGPGRRHRRRPSAGWSRRAWPGGPVPTTPGSCRCRPTPVWRRSRCAASPS